MFLSGRGLTDENLIEGHRICDVIDKAPDELKTAGFVFAYVFVPK